MRIKNPKSSIKEGCIPINLEGGETDTYRTTKKDFGEEIF